MLFRDMGGAEFEGGRRGDCLRRFGGLVISVPDSESSVTGSNLGPCGDISSGNVNHEKVRDIRSALREGGILVAVGESRRIPYFICSQSRTFPMYIAL